MAKIRAVLKHLDFWTNLELRLDDFVEPFGPFQDLGHSLQMDGTMDSTPQMLGYDIHAESCLHTYRIQTGPETKRPS